MTTIGKRSSPRKKSKSLKMKYSPTKYHSPRKTGKVNKATDNITELQRLKKFKANGVKSKKISPSKPLSFRPRSKGLPKFTASTIASKKKVSISGSAIPEVRVPKQTKIMSGENKELSALDATEDVVPSFEMCAEFGFTGKKAEVARTLIKVQRAFNRLRLSPSFNTLYYASPDFCVVFRETAALGAVTVSKYKLWDQFESGIMQLLEMRLAYHRVPRDTLSKSLGYKIASWDKSSYYAGSCQLPNTNNKMRIVPKSGMLGELLGLAVTLHEQIEAVKEFDRVDGATEFAQNAGYY